MRSPAVLLLVASLCGVAMADVTVLDSQNFDTVLDGSKHALVEFYAPWCGHCQQLAPTWDSLGEIASGPDVMIAKVNADEHPELAQAHGVEGYPTIKYFPKGGGSSEDYNGGRGLKAFAGFLDQKAGTTIEVPEGMDAGDEDPFGGGGEYGDEDPYGGEDPYGEGGEGGQQEDPVGVVELSEDTFDKVALGGDFDVLVKFDEAYADNAEWARFSQRVALGSRAPGFLLGAVNVEQYGDKANAALAAKYAGGAAEGEEEDGEDAEAGADFPFYILFTKAGEQVAFDGEPTADGLAAFVDDAIGVWVGEPGHLEAFDKLAKGYTTAPAQERASRLAKAEAELKSADEEDKETAEYYVRVFQRVQEKGTGWVKSEMERLGRLLSGAQLSEAKMEAMAKKASLLSAFMFKGPAGCLEQFDGFVKGFILADDSDKAGRVAAAEGMLAETEPDSAAGKYYVKAMRKVSSNPDWLGKEIPRLQRLLAADAVPADKAEEMQHRLNILSSFS